MLELVVADTARPRVNTSADIALALDLTLGILVGPLLAEAEARVREDANFRSLVNRIEGRLFSEEALGHDAPSGEISPRSETWDAILTEIAKRRGPRP